MEDNMTNVNEITEETEVMDYNPEDESSGSNLGAIVAGIGVCAVMGVSAWMYKNRAKLEEKRVERMRNKGYICYKPEVVDDEACDEEETDKN